MTPEATDLSGNVSVATRTLHILPLGTTTYAEAGIEVTDGGDPGAPIDPKLGQKAWRTTWVSAIVFAIGYAIYALHLIQLPDIPSS